MSRSNRILASLDILVNGPPCGPNCPKSKPCDEIYRDKDVPDHCERCHHPMACHGYELATRPHARLGEVAGA